jgi:hypothetical protein
MTDAIDPEPVDATPKDQSAGKLAELGPQQYLSEEEVAELGDPAQQRFLARASPRRSVRLTSAR